MRENTVSKHAHIGVDYDCPPAPLPTVGQHHAYRRITLDQHPLDRNPALDDPAMVLDRRDQRPNQCVDTALNTISAQ